MSYSRNNPYLSSIKERINLCPADNEKATHHIVLDLADSGITYNVGDCLAVLPVNDAILVERTINALKMQADEKIEYGEGTCSLKDYLRHHANVTEVGRKVVKALAERLSESPLPSLLLPENKEVLSAYLDGKHLWEVLNDYPDAHFSPQEMCDLLAPLLPRFYSIASSQKSVGNEVHLTVKLLAFEAQGERRHGVCTHYLCNLMPVEESVIPVYIHPHRGFTVPEQGEVPIIMVGPGTGVAPFRAFMQERIASGAKGKNWLFFGEWRRSHNFLYGEYWKQLESEGTLRLDVAFSRDQEEKYYVQHRLLENGKELFAWLEEGAYFYVCGDAQKMAKDVEVVLQQIIELHGNKTPEEARDYIKRLRKEKRYLRDVY